MSYQCYDRRVLVIDMCPQANVSSALLGVSGDLDSSKLERIRNDLVQEAEDTVEIPKYFKSM